jgi:AsmA protein
MKFVFGAVAVLLLVFVVLIAVVLIVFEPDDYQQLMTDAVFEQTGRVLAIDGGISLDTLPCCGVEIERSRLGNPEGFPADDFARVESIRLGLRLWPLLIDQEIVIGDIGLDGLELALIRREDGSANWDFPAGEVVEPIEAAQGEAMPALPPLSAGGIRINDARVTYQDQMTGANYRVDDFDLATGAIRIGQPIEMEVNFQATDIVNEVGVQGDLSMSVDVNLDTMQVVAGNVNADVVVSSAILPGDNVMLAAQTESVEFDIESGAIAIKNQRVAVSAVDATVNLSANGTISDGSPELTGTLSLSPLSPRDLLRSLDQPDIATRDPSVFSNLQAKASWSMGEKMLVIDNLDLQLDDTKIEGGLQINYLDQTGLNFKLIGDQLAIDRYLAPEPEPAPETKAAPSAPTEVPVETVRSLEFGGQVGLGRLTMDSLLLENLYAKIKASGGIIRLDPMTADLYGGQYSGTVRINTVGASPVVHFKQSVESVDASGLLTDLADTGDLEGVLQAGFTGKGTGRTDQEIIETLAGDISFNLDDGVYKGVDVWHEIRKARALLKREPAPPESSDPQTPIKVMTFTGRIDDGVLKTKSMVVEVPFLQMKGSGALDLAAENLDFRFQAKVHEKPVFADGEDLASLQGIMIPLTVTGAVASPSVGVDLGELAKSEASKKVEEMLMDKLGLTESDEAEPDGGEPKKEDARDLLKKGVRDLFGR